METMFHLFGDNTRRLEHIIIRIEPELEASPGMNYLNLN